MSLNSLLGSWAYRGDLSLGEGKNSSAGRGHASTQASDPSHPCAFSSLQATSRAAREWSKGDTARAASELEQCQVWRASLRSLGLSLQLAESRWQMFSVEEHDRSVLLSLGRLRARRLWRAWLPALGGRWVGREGADLDPPSFLQGGWVVSVEQDKDPGGEMCVGGWGHLWTCCVRGLYGAIRWRCNHWKWCL